jgi:hypothetical protein
MSYCYFHVVWRRSDLTRIVPDYYVQAVVAVVSCGISFWSVFYQSYSVSDLSIRPQVAEVEDVAEGDVAEGDVVEEVRIALSTCHALKCSNGLTGATPGPNRMRRLIGHY